jgi:hypothetical protein
MSGYLSRLITRSQSKAESQPLRPFVRSTSPIAEQDQRLGVAGFETVDTAMLPQPEINTGDLTPTEGAPTVATPAITPADSVTIQRKPAGPAVVSQTSAPSIGTNNLSSNPVNAGSSDPIENSLGLQSAASSSFLSTPDTPVQNPFDPGLIDARDDSRFQGPQNRYPNLEPTGEPELPQAFQRPVEPPPGPEPSSMVSHQPLSLIPEISPGVIGEDPSPGIEFKPVARGREKLDQSNPDPDSPGSPDIVSVVPSENFPTLIPLEQPPEGLEKPVVEASSAANEHQPAAPRVVIGRINVEVVPQKTPEATVSTAKPGPLTANSVSVIGPLRGRMPANLRLSLRQR